MSKTDHKPLFDVVFSLLANEPGKDNEFFPTGRALCTLQLNQRGFTTVTFKIMRRTPRWSLPGCANHEGPRAPRAGPSAGGRGTGPPPRDAAAGQDAPQNPCPGRGRGTRSSPLPRNPSPERGPRRRLAATAALTAGREPPQADWPPPAARPPSGPRRPPRSPRFSSAPSCLSSWQCGPPRPPRPRQACPAPGRGGWETSGAGGAAGKPRRRRGPSAGVTEALPHSRRLRRRGRRRRRSSPAGSANRAPSSRRRRRRRSSPADSANRAPSSRRWRRRRSSPAGSANRAPSSFLSFFFLNFEIFHLK